MYELSQTGLLVNELLGQHLNKRGYYYRAIWCPCKHKWRWRYAEQRKVQGNNRLETAKDALALHMYTGLDGPSVHRRTTDAHEKNTNEPKGLCTTNLRLHTKNSRQGESRSAWSIYV